MLKIKPIILSIVTTLTLLISYISLAADTITISQEQLIKHLAAPSSNIVVLDVRSKSEYDQGHIEGALNISHSDIEDNLAKLTAYKDKTVVVYCRSGRRAGVAEEILAKNGFTNLRHLSGDMNGWKEAKLPTVTSH